MDAAVKKYLKALSVLSGLILLLSLILANRILLSFFETLRNQIEVVDINHIQFINYRLKISLVLAMTFASYGGLILCLKPFLNKISVKFNKYFIVFPIIGIIIGLPISLLIAKKKFLYLFAIFPQGEQKFRILLSSALSFIFDNFLFFSSLCFALSFSSYILLRKYGFKKFVIILPIAIISLLAIFVSISILLSPYPDSTMSKSNGLLVKDGQIMLLELNGELAAIRPISQTVRTKPNIYGSFMEYEWFYLRGDKGLFDQLVASKGRNIVFDSKIIQLRKIIVAWSPQSEHAGFIHPGGMGNEIRKDIKVIVVDESTVQSHEVREIMAESGR